MPDPTCPGCRSPFFRFAGGDVTTYEILFIWGTPPSQHVTQYHTATKEEAVEKFRADFGNALRKSGNTKFRIRDLYAHPPRRRPWRLSNDWKARIAATVLTGICVAFMACGMWFGSPQYGPGLSESTNPPWQIVVSCIALAIAMAFPVGLLWFTTAALVFSLLENER